ncbi:MAG: hypothetical protein WCF13_05615 [Stellaceae bacterium]
MPAARIEFASRSPSYDNAAPLAQLSKDAGLTVGREALGVTEVKLSLSAQYRIRHAPALTAGVCAYPDDIVLRLSYAVRIVHVARKFANEPCLHAAILAHEMRHVALDDRLIPREAATFDAGLPARIGNGAGFWGADAAAADLRVDQLVTTVGAAFMKTLDDVRRREHVRQIDTPDEQPRIAAACGGRLNQLISATR